MVKSKNFDENRKVRFGAVYSVDVLSIRTLHGKTKIPVLVVKQKIKINSTQCKIIDTDKLGKTEQTRDPRTRTDGSTDRSPDGTWIPRKDKEFRTNQIFR